MTEQSFERSNDNKGQNLTEKTVLKNHDVNGVERQDALDLNEMKTDSETDDESDGANDNEDDEELMERLLILEDAKQLKRLAAAFLHPERPVEVEFNAYARCYFDRPSAPEQETVEEAEERYAILKDAKDLKRLAADYAHPELKVNNTDYLSCARCYFDRPSAPEQESVEDANERALILQDVENLRKAALEYLHPELGVVTSDSTACARCYFDRPSAPEQETVEYAEERHMALADAAALKKLAVDYMHPEVGVVTSDSTACARCYFDRPSAPEQETVEYAEERHMALADAAALKKLAVDYMHPEVGVVTSDSTACARCYFDRPSAPRQADVTEPKSSSSTHVVQILPKVAKATPPKDVANKVLPSHNEVNIIRKSASAVQLYGLDDDHDSASFF